MLEAPQWLTCLYPLVFVWRKERSDTQKVPLTNPKPRLTTGPSLWYLFANSWQLQITVSRSTWTRQNPNPSRAGDHSTLLARPEQFCDSRILITRVGTRKLIGRSKCLYVHTKFASVQKNAFLRQEQTTAAPLYLFITTNYARLADVRNLTKFDWYKMLSFRRYEGTVWRTRFQCKNKNKCVEATLITIACIFLFFIFYLNFELFTQFVH